MCPYWLVLDLRGLLASAAEKVKVAVIPPVPDPPKVFLHTPDACSTNVAHNDGLLGATINDPMAKSKTKLQPSSTKNRR